MATEVKQRNNRVFVIVGVLLAVAAFGLSLYLSQRNSGGSSTGSSAPQVNAVFAATDIPRGTKLVQSQLTVKPVPADSVPIGTPSDPAPLVGKYVSIDVKANQVVQSSFLVADQNTATTAALTTPPLDVHKGFVAMALPVSGTGVQFSSDLVAVGNFIHDDDHIDIIVDPGNGSARYSLQDVRVLHAGSSSQAAGTAPTVLIVEVNRSQAEVLTYLVTNRGPQVPLKYVLRARDDYGKQTGANYADSTDPGIKPVNDPPVNADTFNRLFPAR